MWDNRCVLHRGLPWDAARYKRVMRRTTLAGEGPTTDPPLATRTPTWDGTDPVSSDTQVGAIIGAVRGAGGDVSVSAGGFAGNKLGQGCGSVQSSR